MISKSVIVIAILLVIVLIVYWKNKKKKKVLIKKEDLFFANSDYKKVKEIPAINCIQCGDCLMESDNCCSNCNSSHQYIEEEHCHNHDHSHHHHDQKQHSNPIINIQGYLLLLFTPLIVGAVVYRIINYEKRKLKIQKGWF